jgi:hypothetical protein
VARTSAVARFDSCFVSGAWLCCLQQEVIGTVRGRYFILTRQELDAQTGKSTKLWLPTSCFFVPARLPKSREAVTAHQRNTRAWR